MSEPHLNEWRGKAHELWSRRYSADGCTVEAIAKALRDAWRQGWNDKENQLMFEQSAFLASTSGHAAKGQSVTGPHSTSAQQGDAVKGPGLSPGAES